MTSPTSSPLRAITIRALSLGDRIDISGLERSDAFSTTPLAFHAGHGGTGYGGAEQGGVGRGGMVALFRFGIAVLAGFSPIEEEEIVGQLSARVVGARAGPEDEESAHFAIAEESDDKTHQIGGAFIIKDLSEERFLVIADALAKSVALARDERRVNAVFETIEPLATQLALDGKPPWRRRPMLKLIGQALLVQHRVSGRVAVEEKPDILWDRPDLERLYSRLNDEYELDERAQVLKRKLDVIVETARSLTDVIESDRGTRLEAIVIILISAEVIISLAQIFFGKH